MAATVNAYKLGYDQVVAQLKTITGLRVFDDPRNLNPPCAFVEAPFIRMNSNLVFDMTVTVKIIGTGPGDYKCLTTLLEIADLVRRAQIGLTDVRPVVTTIGGQDYASYELTIGAKLGP
jgi:hypothetical protein